MKTSDEGQVHKLPIATEFPQCLCLEMISSAGEVTMRGWSDGAGGSFGYRESLRAPYALHPPQWELWGERLSLQAGCFQWAFDCA